MVVQLGSNETAGMSYGYTGYPDSAYGTASRGSNYYSGVYNNSSSSYPGQGSILRIFESKFKNVVK